jgi:PAS domain S-box-containing protein
MLVSELMEALLNCSSNGIVAIDGEGKIIIWNKAAEKFLNVRATHALGKPVNSIIAHTRLLDVMETGKAEIGQRFYFGKSVFVVNRTPIIIENTIKGAIAVFQDITELEHAVEELFNIREYKEILEIILENAYEGIVVVDAEGFITMFNKAYGEFLGIDPATVIGKHVTQVIENTRMHLVAQSGQEEIGDIQHIQGKDMICQRIPIFKKGKLVGAVGKIMFKDIKDLTLLVNKVNHLQSELEYYQNELKRVQGARYNFQNIIGETPGFKQVKEMAYRVSHTNSTVLIRGESGTGKELFAHAIHNESPRRTGPFIKVNCAAIPENLLESELFGYEEGAFTGAKKGGKVGKFEMANGGTIFLDEVGDMPLNMQVKLLRVLQEKEIERVGGNKPIKVNVRVIAATNRMLEELIRQEKFRSDLYYRLNVVELVIPPLWERRGDIPLLVEKLLKKISFELGRPVPEIASQTMDIFMNYSWPGNVRELENILERVLNFMDGPVVQPYHLPLHIQKATGENRQQDNAFNLKLVVEEIEKQVIQRALERTNGNRIQAAKLLGISRANIYQKMEKYKLLSHDHCL